MSLRVTSTCWWELDGCRCIGSCCWVPPPLPQPWKSTTSTATASTIATATFAPALDLKTNKIVGNHVFQPGTHPLSSKASDDTVRVESGQLRSEPTARTDTSVCSKRKGQPRLLTMMQHCCCSVLMLDSIFVNNLLVKRSWCIKQVYCRHVSERRVCCL